MFISGRPQPSFDEVNRGALINSCFMTRGEFLRITALAGLGALLAACGGGRSHLPLPTFTPVPSPAPTEVGQQNILTQEQAINAIQDGNLVAMTPQMDGGLDGSEVTGLPMAQAYVENAGEGQKATFIIGEGEHVRNLTIVTPDVPLRGVRLITFTNGITATDVQPEPIKTKVNVTAVQAFIDNVPSMCEMVNRAKPQLKAGVANFAENPDGILVALPFGAMDSEISPTTDLYVFENNAKYYSINSPAGITFRGYRDIIFSQAVHENVNLNFDSINEGGYHPDENMYVELLQQICGDPRTYGIERDEQVANGIKHFVKARKLGWTYEQYSNHVRDVYWAINFFDPIISQEDYETVPVFDDFAVPA